MPLGGFFVYQQKLNFYILVFWGVFGTILGSMPWYYLGKLVNEKRISNFLDKKGKYIGITSNDLIKSRRWFANSHFVFKKLQGYCYRRVDWGPVS